MGNILSSSSGASSTIQSFLADFVALVVWAAYAKKRKNPRIPKKTTQQPEWLTPIYRNRYSRRRIQKMNPKSEEQSMLRDFDLMSMKISSACVDRMQDYLGKRDMPEHLRYIVSEYILDTEGHRALVTPWYKNGNILDFINKRGVGNERKMELIIQIAQGLADLHSLGIAHGNLYPGNVLVTDDEDIVLTDVGIYTEAVKLMLSPSGSIPLPHSTVYKSPKEIQEDEVPTETTDVYAFAGTCYAVMAGQAPFSEIANVYQRVLKITRNGHRSLPKPSSISPMLWGLLVRCWSPDPAQRPTMSDVVEKLLAER